MTYRNQCRGRRFRSLTFRRALYASRLPTVAIVAGRRCVDMLALRHSHASMQSRFLSPLWLPDELTPKGRRNRARARRVQDVWP